MRNLIEYLNSYLGDNNYTVGCCCGHGKYPMTILVKYSQDDFPIEICSDTQIFRKRKFYVKDKNGYYFIPETLKK
jgi:hypothetical protein